MIIDELQRFEDLRSRWMNGVDTTMLQLTQLHDFLKPLGYEIKGDTKTNAYHIVKLQPDGKTVYVSLEKAVMWYNYRNCPRVQMELNRSFEELQANVRLQTLSLYRTKTTRYGEVSRHGIEVGSNFVKVVKPVTDEEAKWLADEVAKRVEEERQKMESETSVEGSGDE